MWLLVLLLLALYSCEKPQTRKEALKPEEVKGLFKERGCTDCHDRTRNIIGPSFVDIAERYRGEKNVENMLLRSLREGSCNKWKARWECMPPQRVEEEEARAMIRWILTLEAESSH